jgi:beta-lactamase class A
MAPALTLLASFLILALACASGDDAPEESPGPAVLIGGPEETVAAATDEPEPGEAEAAELPEPTPTREPVLVSLDWLAGDVSVPGLGGPVAAPAPDAGLQQALAAALASFSGRASVVVHNLADGRYAAVNETDVYYAASTFKAGVLLEAYRQRDAGELDFDKQVPLEEKYVQNDLGTLEYLEIAPNDLVTIRDAVKGMIVVSDTPLALLTIDQVGSNSIDATLREIGATTMTVNDRALPTTALDLAHLMIAIASGYGVSAESRDEMLSYLAQEWFREGIVAGVPEGTTLAHKSGNLGDATHDAAVVWGPSGPYVIVVMTDGSGGWSPISSVSSAVWEYFAASP